MMNMKFGVEGFFHIRLFDKHGKLKRELGFHNLITDLGLNGIGGNGTSWANGFYLGTGTAAPSVSDTALSGTTFGMTEPTKVIGNSSGSPWHSWITYTKTSARGAAAGIWTEIGLGRSVSALWSRELIRDGNGDPTSLTVLSTDYLTLSYTLRVYPSDTDVTGVKTISGVDYDYIVRRYSVGYLADRLIGGNWVSTAGIVYGYDGAFNAAGAAPSGNSSYASSNLSDSVDSYSNNSLKLVYRFKLQDTHINLAGGITSIIPWLQGGYIAPFKFNFTPAIPKNNTKEFSMAFSLSWARRT